jgi:hypothetical protein
LVYYAVAEQAMVDGNLDADTIDELSHKYELFADILKEYDDDEFIID